MSTNQLTQTRNRDTQAINWFPVYPAREEALMDGDNPSIVKLNSLLAAGMTVEEIDDYYPERPNDY